MTRNVWMEEPDSDDCTRFMIRSLWIEEPDSDHRINADLLKQLTRIGVPDGNIISQACNAAAGMMICIINPNK